jgi:lipopolysaccharide export system permease protein
MTVDIPGRHARYTPIRPASIISRYIFREISVSFLFCFGVFFLAGLIAGFLPILQKGVEAGLDLTMILFQVLINALPSTLVTVLPLSITIGILLGMGRLAADNEISAIKSSGISVVHLLPPVVLLGLIGFLLSLVCTLFLIPKGVGEARQLMQGALLKRVDAGIEERTFFDSLKNLMVYVEKIEPQSGIMSRIFIRESSNQNEIAVILAKKGKSLTDPKGKAFILELKDGIVLKSNRQGEFLGSLEFESYVFRYSLDQTRLEAAPRSLEELSISGIRTRVDQVTAAKPNDPPEVLAYYNRVKLFARVLIMQRITHPMACLALAFAAFPLGALNLGKSRLNNVSVGLAVVFMYYAATLAAERAARSAVAAPEFVMPMPPVIFIMLALYFVRCVRLEKMPKLFQFIEQALRRTR